MSVVRNVTPDVLALFRPDAPPVEPGDSVELKDEHFAGRAWPKSTWELVKKPGKGYVDRSTDDAHLFLTAEAAKAAEGATTADTPVDADTEEKA